MGVNRAAVLTLPMQFIRSDSLVVNNGGQLGSRLSQVNTRLAHAFHSSRAWPHGNIGNSLWHATGPLREDAQKSDFRWPPDPEF
jgi:fermentation-respiration switch protein FrsA (DUF1100 family)